MKYMMPPNGTEDGTYHWIMGRDDGSIHIGLYNEDSILGNGWTILGFSYDLEPLLEYDWEYLKPVVPYDATT